MEARILQLPTTEIRVDGDRIVVERLVVRDPRSPRSWPSASRDDRPAFVERALKIGLTALQDAAVTVDVDVVRDEFEKLLRPSEQANARAAEALDQRPPLELRRRRRPAAADAREVPRRPRRAPGVRRRAVRRDEARQRDRPDADAARHVLRRRRIEARRSSSTRRASTPRCTSSGPRSRAGSTSSTSGSPRSRPRPRRAAPSGPGRRPRAATSRTSSRRCSRDIARGSGDLVDRTGGEAGELLRSKKGDFVVTVDPARTGGAELRVVIEAKDRAMSVRAIREELREAKENRAAAVGLVVFSAGPRAGRHRPVRRPRRRRLLRRRPGRAGSGRRSRRRCGWPGCWRSPACARSRPRSTSRRSGRRSPASGRSSTRSRGSRRR